MELTVKDRLYIPAVLPKECNYREFNLRKDILRKIEISEREREQLGLHENTQNGRIEWDVEKDTPLHAEFTAEELAFLKQACEKISDECLPADIWTTVEAIYDAAQSSAKP